MNKEMKGLIVILVLISILLAGCGTNPGEVSETAARIADFRLPDGYQPELAVEIGGYSLVSYTPGDAHSHLYLCQAPADVEITQETLEEMLPTGKQDRTTRLTVVEKRPVMVRGQEVAMMISEGINGEGESYRQAVVAFQGKEGPALLVLSTPDNRWEDALVDELIASIQ